MGSSGLLGPGDLTFRNLVDAERSWIVGSRETARGTSGTSEEKNVSLTARATKRHRCAPREEPGCFAVDISPDGEHSVEKGAQTIFVNAAMDLEFRPTPKPWLVEMDLPVADERDDAAAVETVRRLML